VKKNESVRPDVHWQSPFFSNIITSPEILRLHLQGETLGEDVILSHIASRTLCYSGSDLKSKYLPINNNLILHFVR
jgi:hypothetical protein